MLASAIADFFKYKLLKNIVIVTCTWSSLEKLRFARELSHPGIASQVSCDPRAALQGRTHMFQGIVVFDEDNVFKKMDPEYFSAWYKWLILRNDTPSFPQQIRYDADVVLLITILSENVHFEEVFFHPVEGPSSHPWATWSRAGLNVTHDRERVRRRHNLKKHVLKIAAPTGHYSPTMYPGSMTQYLREQANPERDSAIRCGYGVSYLIAEMLNATEHLYETKLWSSTTSNESMLVQVASGAADMGAGILRMMPDRASMLDYIIPIWPFNVGFTYLAERKSSSNMYVEPFSGAVWWTCLAIVTILALCQRATARKPEEKEGAYIGVLATWLQQDASAVPEGVSGRWSFMVMSTSAMLVHAYYTSAVVSALLRTGTDGPRSLRALADSKYAIASEDFDYMRYLFFDVKTNSTELEYLKRKKMTSKLYQDVRHGVKLIQEGNTAYHTEYNQIYIHFNTFTDDQLCKLQYLDTIPEIPTWITTAKRGQYLDVFRTKGAWLKETGLAHRLVSRLRLKPPPCRAALLAERVNFGDVASLLLLSVSGAILAFIVLAIEVVFSNVKKVGKGGGSQRSIVQAEVFHYVD